MTVEIRNEQSEDGDAIRDILRTAFASHPHSTHNEGRIVDVLRAANALTVSLVAVVGGSPVGYVACSRVALDGQVSNWHGLGPIAVRPEAQQKGIGAALMRASMAKLETEHAGGIVLLGDPKYYRRFGFEPRPELALAGVPPSHFLSLPMREVGKGLVTYHNAFSIE